MITPKKFLLCLLVVLSISTYIYTENNNRAYGYNNEADEINFFDFDDDHVPEFDPDQFKQACELTKCDFIQLITGPDIALQDVLMHNLYLRTAPPIVRALQTEPILEARRINLCDGQNQFSAKFFFNQMRKAYLSPCSPYMDSFLALFSNTDLIAAIDKAAMVLQENLNIPEVLPLFSQLKLEQRRIGAMLTFQRRNGSIEWRMLLPVYYLEHNFFLTKEEQDAIANAPLFKSFGNNSTSCSTGEDQVKEFITEHLVNDAFGFGDLRAQVFFDIIDTDYITSALGLELNFPSAITLARGIIGRTYPSCPVQPTLNLFDLICLAQENPIQAGNIGKDYAVNVLDRLTEIAAQNNLGALHMGIGFLGEFLYHFNETYTWRNNFRLFYNFSANEPRFFRPTKTDAEFNRDYDNCNNIISNLNFLNQQAVLFFYPPVTKANVTPGLILQYTTAINLDYGWFKCELGYDYWHKTREDITIADYYFAPPALDIEPGIQAAATQQKLFTTLWFDHSDSCRDWRFGLFGDVTIASKGIGKDWMAGLDVSTLF